MELQHFFVKIRDELCKNGEILLTPALSYTSKHLHADIDQEKREKLPQEIEEDRLKREEDKKGSLLLMFSEIALLLLLAFLKLCNILGYPKSL